MKQFVTAPTEERMRSVVDHVLDAIITINAQGMITTFNRAAERIFGYPAEEWGAEHRFATELVS